MFLSIVFVVLLPDHLNLPLLGLVTWSATEYLLRLHSLEALYSDSGLAVWFMGSGQFSERCGSPSLQFGTISLLTLTDLVN